MKLLLILFALLATNSLAAAQDLAPIRTVSGQIVTSPHDPSARIEVIPPAVYAGALRFVLFGVADCEIHLFVDADESKRVRRIYWIQFEQYLPEHPTLRYAPHPAFAPVTMSGLGFFQRARFGGAADVPAAGSEAERVFGFLRANGYTLPLETVNVTYKHFLDPSMRKELLLIVLDDMSSTGATFAQLVQNGAVQPAWGPIAERLLVNAAKVFSISIRP
jgi:hypothetical protein